MYCHYFKDFVEDYEIYAPFKALQSLGCKVDAISPSKKEGESCVTVSLPFMTRREQARSAVRSAAITSS